MADEDDRDFNIESADAGASATIPMEAGQIKKGGYVEFISLSATWVVLMESAALVCARSGSRKAITL
jgi:hypothetical protein